MKVETATAREVNSKWIGLRMIRRVIRWVRPLLAVAMYVTLFLPWWDSKGTDFDSLGCRPDCPPVSGFLMWLAYAGWLMCCPAIPLATLLPSALFATIWPKLWVLLAYRVSLLLWLLITIWFAWDNANVPLDRITYLTPYIGLALAVAASILEAVDLCERVFSITQRPKSNEPSQPKSTESGNGGAG